MQEKALHNRSGQALIEIIIAALIIIFVSLAIAELVNTSVKSAASIRGQGAATFLSGEAADAVRAVAQEDWHNISNLATSSANLYQLNTTSTISPAGSKWIIATGTQTVALNSVNYSRSFYFTDVRRSTSTGDIVSAGGFYDPSTIKVNIAVNWTDNTGSARTFTQIEYLSRYLNTTYAQTDWSGGTVGEVVTTNSTTSFATSTGIDTTSTPGSIQLQTL